MLQWAIALKRLIILMNLLIISMSSYSITINAPQPQSDELAAYIQEAVQYADSAKLIDLLKAMRGKDGRSHNSTINKALSLKKFL